mgnify:CR=1 FL=1
MLPIMDLMKELGLAMRCIYYMQGVEFSVTEKKSFKTMLESEGD